MKTKRIIKDQKGGALIEFAIVLPLLVVLAFGIIEFGIILYNQSIITNASREGARAGIIEGTSEADIKDIVDNYALVRLITFGTPIASFPNGWITINDGAGIDTTSQAPLEVYVRYDYTFLVPVLFGLDSTKTLGARTVMLME